MHHVGGNLVVDGINIEVEHRQRVLGDIAAIDSPTERPTSQRISNVLLVVASQAALLQYPVGSASSRVT